MGSPTHPSQETKRAMEGKGLLMTSQSRGSKVQIVHLHGEAILSPVRTSPLQVPVEAFGAWSFCLPQVALELGQASLGLSSSKGSCGAGGQSSSSLWAGELAARSEWGRGGSGGGGAARRGGGRGVGLGAGPHRQKLMAIRPRCRSRRASGPAALGRPDRSASAPAASAPPWRGRD